MLKKNLEVTKWLQGEVQSFTQEYFEEIFKHIERDKTENFQMLFYKHFDPNMSGIEA